MRCLDDVTDSMDELVQMLGDSEAQKNLCLWGHKESDMT